MCLFELAVVLMTPSSAYQHRQTVTLDMDKFSSQALAGTDVNGVIIFSGSHHQFGLRADAGPSINEAMLCKPKQLHIGNTSQYYIVA